MAHEITSTDQVVLAKTGAWHGLGKVFPEQLTVEQSLAEASLGWEVEQCPTYALVGDGESQQRIVVESHVTNVRSDTKEVLGVVGKDWKPVQNRRVAEFATQIADNADNVRVETAGSFKGGKRVWFLLDTGSVFELPGEDINKQYVLLTNGHDGGLSFSGLGTSVRVVCKNTHGFAIGGLERDVASGKAFTIRHTGNIDARVEQCSALLKAAVQGAAKYEEIARALASRKLTSENELRRFFVGVYESSFGLIPTQPKDDVEQRRLRAATDRVASWLVNFSEGPGASLESSKNTAWGAFNAVTAWSDHDRAVRPAKSVSAADARRESKLLGTGAAFKNKAFAQAVALI